jgi:hypothetical protein
MRALLALVLVAGCSGQLKGESLGNGNDMGAAPGGEGPIPECVADSDCVAAGLKCCDCPTYATPANDPAVQACGGVMCPASTCPDNVRAACSSGQCVLACKPLACSMTCADGYVIDATGCEECTCATPASRSCTADSQCVRTRADCCGCAGGGTDTAVLASEQASYDASLMCPSQPTCMGGDTCAPDLAPACVEGSCALVSPLPPGACGRPDLPACPSGQTCMLNAVDAATERGVGVCM